MPLNQPFQFFASVPKGIEDILAGELRVLGVDQIKPTVAGVAFSATLDEAYRVCLWSRTANRILLMLDRFDVQTQDDLYYGVKRINWFEHLRPDGSFAVSFNAKDAPAIANTHFGALKVKDAIVDQMRAKFQKRPNIDTDRPDIRVNVYLHRQTAQLSLDLSGESLHRRSYREAGVSAPIKENLAAAILLKSGWPEIAGKHGTLLDPMCGSGTLLIEGALIAGDMAPGLLRDYFGFLGWKQHDAECWRQLRQEAEQRRQAGKTQLPFIVGFDQSRASINAALVNIAHAGLENIIHVERRAIEQAEPAAAWQPGLVVCNPPYGERLGDAEQVANLYKQFGATLKRHFSGWQAAIIISDGELGFRLGIRSKKPITLYNGALECKLLRLKVEDAAFFTPKAKTRDERIELIQDNLSGDPVESEGVAMFANRLHKNLKKLAPWAERQQVNCYRVYDADIPEYAVAIDLYQGEKTWVNVQEYEPPKSVDPLKADRRLAGLIAELPNILAIPSDQVFLKIRRRQKNSEQYEKRADLGDFHVVEEGGCKFWVNFQDYLDTGLFLDHRPIRQLIRQQAKGCRFLNLFAYTGSVTVYAAVGGAKATTSVDMSNTYLNWAQRNLALNRIRGNHEFIQANCLEWLAREAQARPRRQYDLIFLDPPTFSNSKKMAGVFDVQRDHVSMILNAVKLLAPQGMLYFSTNFRRFKLDREALSKLRIEDISASTVPEDFSRNPKIHFCWRIQA